MGSGYLGYVIAVLALADSARQPAHIWAWLVLGGVFFVDASVTLVRRAWRGERLHEAHRQHAYQRLARRWGSHAKVAAAVLLVNLLWLFPWAIFAARHPPWALPTAFLSLLPLVLVAVAVGQAGTPRRAIPEGEGASHAVVNRWPMSSFGDTPSLRAVRQCNTVDCLC